MIFTVQAAVRVDLNDRYDLEHPPLTDIDVVATVPFEKVEVDRRVVAAQTPEAAIAALEPFINPRAFQPPEPGLSFWNFFPRI